MSPAIFGLGTAVPSGTIAQEEALALARAMAGGEDPRRLAVLYRNTMVRRRASVVFAPDGSVPASPAFYAPPLNGERGPRTAERLSVYAAEAPGLAERACLAALADAAVTPPAITHLVTVSCTGFAAPGLDVTLIRRLGLRPTTARAQVGFMGCHGAINGLRVADAIVRAHPDAAVLLCAVELCSLHFQYHARGGQAVANALFADGAGAAVIGRSVAGPSPARSIAPVRLRGFGSCLLPDSAGDMTWTIGDHGFEMTLSARVPELLKGQLRPWVGEWLGAHGLRVPEIPSWAVHPGGPRILDAVADALELPRDALTDSREVLAEHGNMSSPTILFILDRMRRRGAPRPMVALAFGPGLMAEGMILE